MDHIPLYMGHKLVDMDIRWEDENRRPVHKDIRKVDVDNTLVDKDLRLV